MGKEFQNNFPASHRIMSNLMDGLFSKISLSGTINDSSHILIILTEIPSQPCALFEFILQMIFNIFSSEIAYSLSLDIFSGKSQGISLPGSNVVH